MNEEALAHWRGGPVAPKTNKQTTYFIGEMEIT